MTSTKAYTTERTQAVFEAACAFAGLDATDAKRVRFGENAIYRLADGSAVVRVGRSIPAATKEVLVAGWLAENRFPAATVLEGNEQPFVEDGLPVTFWNCLEEDDTPITPAEFGKLLHDLHALPHPTDFRLPAFSPMPKVEPRLQALKGKLPEADLDFLRDRYEELSERFQDLEFPLPAGPVHGDAHPGNVMRSPDGTLNLIDFEDFAYGPREWDAAVLSVRHQAFGWASEAEYDSYTAAYGFDPIDWPGFPVVRATRELNMTMWLSQTVDESAEVKAEVEKRISDLRDDQAPRHWKVF
ncbi:MULTISPECIES: aminoglycoside phosphotransferase family protein [unclassified Amycolatopsis]|uniref:phosphotransferase enzyme family protein n=1 Tax=unclassified Amycolatopsis TaxID=2618356 RepID=UPI002875E33D|nr:aminoglycoside phosphotransferase family protein [Amycolatopsis sp. 505]MDS0133701.1 aminoglycoside phosphotransferase family protein [Amycolatopsis sp. 505]MDS0148454.1 aminoglycoside phosphotransferase family protein [Amycolatopsis sp. CM201R]